MVYNNETHSILVQPGPEGEAQFIREVRRIFQLSEVRGCQGWVGSRSWDPPLRGTHGCVSTCAVVQGCLAHEHQHPLPDPAATSPPQPQSAELALSFGCRLPNGQGEVTLEGASAFGAAAFLASLSAGERLQRAAAQHAQQAQRAQRESEDVQQATPVQSATSRWRRLF